MEEKVNKFWEWFEANNERLTMLSEYPADEKEKIFEKFYSDNQKIADHRRSIGLGLYLCKVIIEAHGGTIYVTDNQPHGAIFHFTIPLEDVMIYA